MKSMAMIIRWRRWWSIPGFYGDVLWAKRSCFLSRKWFYCTNKGDYSINEWIHEIALEKLCRVERKIIKKICMNYEIRTLEILPSQTSCNGTNSKRRALITWFLLWFQNFQIPTSLATSTTHLEPIKSINLQPLNFNNSRIIVSCKVFHRSGTYRRVNWQSTILYFSEICIMRQNLAWKPKKKRKNKLCFIHYKNTNKQGPP